MIAESSVQRLQQLRSGRSEDWPFIFATWLRCYRYSSAFAQHIQEPIFFRYHHAAIQRILERGAEVRIAHLADDPSVILGYLVTEPGVVHFAYVKKAFRRHGIASDLFHDLDVNSHVFTHWTRDWNHMLKRWPEATYNPYLI